MNAHRNPSPRRRIAAVVIAGSLVGVVGAMSVADAQQPTTMPDAGTRAERAAIVRWAMDNGMSGLSPASLSPADANEARVAAERKQIVEWAISEGVSGLSPASAQSVEG